MVGKILKSIRTILKPQLEPIHILEGYSLQNVRLRGVSRCGLLSWRGLLAGNPVKIYECFTEVQAVLIENVSQNPDIGKYFPIIYLRRGKYLFVEWIEGDSLNWQQIKRNPKLLEEIVKLQVILHSHKEPSSFIDEYSYASFLLQRCQRFQGLFLFQEVVQQIIEDLERFSFDSETQLSHPDFTAANLVLEKGSGELKIIDNELLTQNPYYLIDLFNTCRSIDNRFQDEFIKKYLKNYLRFGGDLSTLLEYAPFFYAMWHLRTMGSLLQSGVIYKAKQIADQYLKGDINEHPIIRITKELS